MGSRDRRKQREGRYNGTRVDRHPNVLWRTARLALACFTLAALAACNGSSSSDNSGNTSTISTTASAPVIKLQPSPSSVPLGFGTTLAWDVSSADSCVASGGWTGTKAVSGSATTDALAAPTTFVLTCKGPGGTASQSAEVKVTGAATPPSVSLVAEATTLSAGMSTELKWTSADASACKASGAWSGNLKTSGSQTTGALTETKDYTLTCTGPGGSATQSTTVTVIPLPPSISISAAPSSVTAGATTVVKWTTSNAIFCTGSGAWNGLEPLSGSLTTGALEENTSYTLSCTGVGGSATQSVLISVVPAVPMVSFNATPSTIVKGSSAVLSWTSTNTSSCVASGSWTGVKPLAGKQTTGSLQASGTYTLKCTGTGGSATQSTTVTVDPSSGAPTVSLSVGPSAVKSGGKSTLTWSSTNATSCTASGDWSGAKALKGSQSTGALTKSVTYTLTCKGPKGTAAQSATVSVTAPAPTISISANPSTITAGESAILTWVADNASRCTASGPWSGSQPASGSQTTGTLQASTTYSLTCSGPGGVATQEVTVSVTEAAPVVTITADPTTVKSGATSTLTWSSSNATSCVASGGWAGGKAVRGSQKTVALSATTTFALTCTGNDGSASQSATVTVAETPPSVSLTASPSSIASGATSLLSWSSSHATACTASGGWSGNLATSGSKSTAALKATTTYTLTCTGDAGSVTASATVTVKPPSSGTATLSWSPPKSNTNGTPLTPLKGYTIFYGTSAKDLSQSVFIPGANSLSYEISGLTEGTWYFAVQADADDGTHSALSSLGSKTF